MTTTYYGIEWQTSMTGTWLPLSSTHFTSNDDAKKFIKLIKLGSTRYKSGLKMRVFAW